MQQRPLYGLEQLKQKPNAPILVVEGEKTCKAARLLFPDHAVITWSGGCGSVHKTDWSPLKGRDVTLFPDHDQPGLNAALRIGDILAKQSHSSIHIVDLPETVPHKWDLADAMPEHVTLNALMANTKTHSEMKFEHYQKTHESHHQTFTLNAIKNHAEKHELLDMCSDEKLPLIQYFANEYGAYQKAAHTLLNIPINHEDHEQRAIFAGLYAHRAHVLIDGNPNDLNFSDKFLMIGHFAAQTKMNGKDYKNETDRVFDAISRYKDQERKYERALKTPPESIQHETKEIQEGLLYAVLKFKAITQKDMPVSLTHDLYHSVKKITEEAPSTHHKEIIKHTIDHIIEQKSQHTFVLHDLTYETLSFRIKNNQLNLQKIMQHTHDKTLEMEHQRHLNRELHRGSELSL